MSRIARAVVPGLPHHVTQLGNRRERVFFEKGDYVLYRDLLAERARKLGVQVWGWCLMPNHVHLIVAPKSEDGLARAKHGKVRGGGVHQLARLGPHLPFAKRKAVLSPAGERKFIAVVTATRLDGPRL